jgi:hypothetical protein
MEKLPDAVKLTVSGSFLGAVLTRYADFLGMGVDLHIDAEGMGTALPPATL